MPRSAATPATATSTIGVTMPSLRPLSTLRARRTCGGTRGLDMTGAPSAASVGASAAPTRRAAHGSKPSTTMAAPAPRATVSGRPTPSRRAYRPRSRRNWSSRTREASAKRTQTRVTSAISRTSSGSTARSNRSNPSANSHPPATNTIGSGQSDRLQTTGQDAPGHDRREDGRDREGFHATDLRLGGSRGVRGDVGHREPRSAPAGPHHSVRVNAGSGHGCVRRASRDRWRPPGRRRRSPGTPTTRRRARSGT